MGRILKSEAARKNKREYDRRWRKEHPNYPREWFTRRYGRVQAVQRKKSKREREIAQVMKLLRIIRRSMKQW